MRGVTNVYEYESRDTLQETNFEPQSLLLGNGHGDVMLDNVQLTPYPVHKMTDASFHTGAYHEPSVSSTCTESGSSTTPYNEGTEVTSDSSLDAATTTTASPAAMREDLIHPSLRSATANSILNSNESRTMHIGSHELPNHRHIKTAENQPTKNMDGIERRSGINPNQEPDDQYDTSSRYRFLVLKS
jgi:hypothetical protein